MIETNLASATLKPRIQPATLRLRKPTVGDAKSVKKRRYYLYSFDAENGWQPNKEVPFLDIEDGQLYINGIQILEPNIQHDHFTWLQHAEDGNGTHYLSGHLHVNSNGLEAHGAINIGTTHKDVVSHTVLASVIPSVNYKTKITKTNLPIGTDPGKLQDSDYWL